MIETRQREALRQQMMLRALLGDARPAVVEGWLGGDATRKRAGLAAYRANAGALAERALAAAVPTVAQLLGDESFAGFARAFWTAHPPTEFRIGHHARAGKKQRRPVPIGGKCINERQSTQNPHVAATKAGSA